MRRSLKRGCLPLAAMLLLSLFAACSLTGLAIHTRAIDPPPVLLHNHLFWLGDRCRAYLNTPAVYEQRCLPGYTVDLVVYGRSARHYIVFHIPASHTGK